MVDVEHRALRALEEDRLPGIEGVIDEFGGVANVGADFFALFESFFHFVGEIDIRAVRAFRQAIFFSDDAGGFFAEERGVQQIAHAEAATGHFVFVSGTDAAGSCADFVCAARAFGGFVEFAVIRKDQMRAIADVQTAVNINACFRQRVNFVDERAGVDDDPCADDGMLLGAENPARNQLEDVLFLADDDGVACVVAASDTRDVIK